jgi:hypothetical protein
MRFRTRNFAAWSVALALLAGLWLPLSAADTFDADGICGPALVQGHAAERLDVARAVPVPGHCLFCHLRHDMAGAFVSSILQITSPVSAAEALVASSIDRHTTDSIGDACPRGPPARS